MSSLLKTAQDFVAKGPHKFEDSPKRVRILLKGKFIVDTTAAKAVWEHPWYPHYYIPTSAIQHASLEAPTEGEGFRVAALRVDSHLVPDSVAIIESGPLSGHARFDFNAMDGWLEEDDPVYSHPTDPYKRIDIRQSTRDVRVEIDGVVVAESSWAMCLFETGLVTRYYLPRTAAKWEMLSPSSTVTVCPYKGEANYYSVTVNGQVHKDVIWWYKTPIPESSRVAGMLCFYNEKVDIFLDGKKLEGKKA